MYMLTINVKANKNVQTQQGEHNSNARMRVEDVRAIRRRHKELIEQLSKEYGINYSHTLKIIYRTRWAELTDD
jgi:hypothetical protein